MEMRIKFVQYEQSSHCKSMLDSNVSYASAVVTVEEQ
jgi:predicted class III extradiol MEMO1 family dioxygenase